MCVQHFHHAFDVHRYSKVLTARGTSKHDVESYLDPDIFAPDPAELCDADDSCGNHQVKNLGHIMNSSEDEPLSGLNARLRPRRRTTSPQSKSNKKSESRTHDRPKRTSTPSRAFPNKPDDDTSKADSLPAASHLCPHCDRKFSSKQTVLKHARRIHLSNSKQDFFIACLFCNHTEAEAGDIIRHMVDNHPNQYFACLDCQTRFSSTSELAEHKLNVCERQRPYRSKLRQKNSSTSTKAQKSLNIDRRDDFQNNKEYIENRGFNGIVISCELKPSQIHDEADIEDNITTNLILPPSKSLANSTVIEKNAVIVLDDIQWNKRIPPNFSFHNTDADQILSRLGVVHRSPRTGETTRRDWFKTIDDSTQKFEKCFETSFYSKVASNVAENLAKCLDGSFNFNPDLENTIKTRKAKNSVVINTAEGFPILLAREQYSRNLFDSYMPRSIAPKHKWKWDSPESDKSLMNPDQIKRDSHTNNCIITLVSSLDIWTQLSMRKKFEKKFNISHVEKKTEKQSIIDKELKEILESRELPTTSSTQIIKYSNSPPPVRDGLDFPSYLGLAPSAPSYNLQPAVLSGEWVRPRCYVCCACGAQTRDSRALSSHISIQHPNAQVQHYEIVGEPLLNADILKHLYVPPSQVNNRTRPLRGIRDCTKCQKSITLKDLHQHMLDCAGDTPAVRRKVRYRPFGVRRRRPRLPDNVIRRKIRKDLRNRHKQKNHLRPTQKIRSEVGDAETIRKMIADLPAKRHRVVVNPMNPTLRPRRKLDKQRSKLLLKHRSADDSKSRKLRSIKDLNNSTNSVNVPPNKEDENKTESNQDDEDNKPLKPTRRPIDGKNTLNSDTIKRKTMLNRAKRKIQMKNVSIVKLPDVDNIDASSSSNSPDEELEKSNAPKKIDINNSQHSPRQHTGRGNHNRGHSNRSNSHRGNNDRGNSRGNSNRGNHDRGNRGYFDRGNNSRDNSNRGNDNHGNNNRGQGQGSRENKGDDKDKMESEPPAESDPLRHSTATTSTADGKTKVKSKDPQHLPTRQADSFENEAADSRLDKLPSPCDQKIAIDPQKNKSTKVKKGKALNCLIDKIKMKKNIETGVGTPGFLSAKSSALETDVDPDPTVSTDVNADQVNALPSLQQDAQQVPETSVQTDERQLIQPDAGLETDAIQTSTSTVIKPTGKPEVIPAMKTKSDPTDQPEDLSVSRKEHHASIHKGVRPHALKPPDVLKDDRADVHKDVCPGAHKDDSLDVPKDDGADVHTDVPTDHRRAVTADDPLAAYAITMQKARSLQAEMERTLQPDGQPIPHPSQPSEGQVFAHHLANLSANTPQHSAEHPLAKPDARASLALHGAEHLSLHSVAHLTAHQPSHPVRHPMHPAMYPTIRPEFALAQYNLAQAHLAAQAHYQGVNPMDPRLFMSNPYQPKIDPKQAEAFSRPILPLERGLSYLQHNIACDQVAHGLPLSTENLTQPSTPPKRTPVRRKSTRLSKSNVQPDLPQSIFGLTPPEIIPPKQFQDKYSSMMISPDSDQKKKRKQSDIVADPQMNISDFSKSPKTAEYLHTSGGQLIENKSYQPVATEPSTRSPVESTILEDQWKIAERMAEIKTNSEQTKPSEFRPHAEHVIPEPLKQTEQGFRLQAPYPYSSMAAYVKYNEQVNLPLNRAMLEYMRNVEQMNSENRALYEQIVYPGLKSHIDKNLYPDPQPHPDSRTYTEQMPFQNPMLLPEMRPFPDRSLEQLAYEQRYLNQRLFPDQPLCPNQTSLQEQAKKYPELMQLSQQAPYPNQALYPAHKTAAEKNVDQQLPNEQMLPPENTLLTKRRSSKEMKSVPERKLSTDQGSTQEGRLSNDLPSAQEQNITKEQKTAQQTNDLKLPVEQTPTPKLPAKLRLSAERRRSAERRSAEHRLTEENKLGNELKPPHVERRPSMDSRPSVVRAPSVENRASVDCRPATETRPSFESQPLVERRSSKEHWRPTVQTPSVEHQPSIDGRAPVKRQSSVERPPSTEIRASKDSRLSVVQAPSVEKRPSMEHQPPVAHRPAISRPSVVRAPSVERRSSVEHCVSIDQKLSADYRPTVVRAPSTERRPSVERRFSGESRLSVESRISSDRRPSFERDPSCEGRLSKDLPHVNELTCQEKRPSEQGTLNKQWPAINQHLLHDQRLEEGQAQISVKSMGGQRSLKEQKSSNEKRHSQHRSSSEQKTLTEQELIIHNNPIRTEETVMMPQTYSSVTPHYDPYIQNRMMADHMRYRASTLTSHVPHPKHELSHIKKDDSVPKPLDLSGRTTTPQARSGDVAQHNMYGINYEGVQTGSTDSRISHPGNVECWGYPSDYTVNRPTLPVFKPWNPENKKDNTTYDMHIMSSRDLAEREAQEHSNIMNDAKRNVIESQMQEYSTMNDGSRIRAERESVEYSNNLNDTSRISIESAPSEYSNTINDASRPLAEREPIFMMTNSSSFPPDFLGKSTTTSDFVDKPISEDLGNSSDFLMDEDTYLDVINTTEDIKPEYEDSMDIKTELPTSLSNVIENAENTHQLNSNSSVACIMAAKNSTPETDMDLQITKTTHKTITVSKNSELYAAVNQSTINTFTTSSLTSGSDASSSLPLSNPVMTTTVNEHKSTSSVHTSADACISDTEIESSNSASQTNCLYNTVGTTIANATADTIKEASLIYGTIQNSDSQMGPDMRSSHMQNTTSEATTHKDNSKNDPKTQAVNKVDASTATNETPDPETARKIAFLPQDVANVLEDLPTEKRNILLTLLPPYDPSTKQMLVHENMHAFIPNYQLPTNMQHCPPQFMGSYNMDKTHPMSYLPSVYQVAPPPPPPPQFTMLPPPPPPPPLVTPPLPPPVKEETLEHDPPLQSQPTFIPPLPPNSPPPLFPLPAVIKTDEAEDDEDVKPTLTDIKTEEERDIESENHSVDQMQPGPSNVPKKKITSEENAVIDLTEETPPANIDAAELGDDRTKRTLNPSHSNHFVLAVPPNPKTISDKTSSLRAVRIKTPSERNKSSTLNITQNRSNTEPEISAAPAIEKDVQQFIKAINERETEKDRRSSELTDQPVGNDSVENMPIFDQFQDFDEDEDNKLLQWKISLAIQRTEISSTKKNKKNKAITAKPTATVSSVESLVRPEYPTTNESLDPVVPTEDIVIIKTDNDLIDNSILEPRTVISTFPEQDSHVLDRSQSCTTASQNYELIDEAHLPSKDNTEPKINDQTSSCTAIETVTSKNMTNVHGQLALTVKQDNTLEDDDSDDDVSLAIIVKNRDQLKNYIQTDSLTDNKSAGNDNLVDNTKEDIVVKETTNNLNKDRTIEPNSHIHDRIETKHQLQQPQIIQKPPLSDTTNEIQSNKAHFEKSSVKEMQETKPTKLNNRKKSNGNANDQKVIETIRTVRNASKEDISKARNIVTTENIIEKESSNSAEQLIINPCVVSETRDQQINSLKKAVEVGIKSSSVMLKPNDTKMLEVQKDKLKLTSTNDDLTHSKTEIKLKSIPLKTAHHKRTDVLAERSTESHPPNNTNNITKESSAADETQYLKEITDKNISTIHENHKKVLETNFEKDSNDFERDKNNTTPLRRSRRRKSALGEDDILDEPGASTEQKIPLTKKQLIFSKLLLDEEIHAGPQAHSTPENKLSPVEESIQTDQPCLKSSPSSPVSDIALEQTPERDQGKRKRTKRKKSLQFRSLYKKKKSYEFNDKSELGGDKSKKLKKKSKTRLQSESSVKSHSTIKYEEHSVNENKTNCSPIENKDLATTTNSLALLSGPTTVNEKSNTSGDKRKVPEDCIEIIKTKKLKFLDNSEQDLELKHDSHILKEKVSLSLEKRTACYMPVAARRTRSKSVIVKSSTADFYDPYDIDLDDMIEKPDSFRRKMNVDKNTQNLKIQNQCKSKSNIQSETSSKTNAFAKKSSKPSHYHVNYGNKMAARSKTHVTDSDDSTKSDVPLTKYIEDKEKKTSKTVSKKRIINDTVPGRSGKKNVKGKRKIQDIKRNRRTLTTFNDIDKSTTPNDAEELRSEKFMESFGFFSQRKPRKSNLLASKKISETFHIIGNESDDAYFGSKKRTQKRSLHNENKKSIASAETVTRPRRRVAPKKIIRRNTKIRKKVYVQPVPCFCRLCKKEFQRPDNFLRHQMTVLHASKLSEIELKLKTIPIIEKPNYLIVYKRQLDRLKLLTKKYANKKNSKYGKNKLPSLDKILAKVNRKVRQQKLAQRGLSRDEALFIDCCQLLKSNKSDLTPPDPISFNAVPNHFSESTVKTFDLLEKPLKGDGDVDSITAKNILESDEVKNLEKDLISGLKEAANEGALKTKIMYQRSVSDVGLNQIDDEQLDYSSSKGHESKFENVEPSPVSNPTKMKKQPEFKEKMYPDVIESIDMFEDKFDKIKRKCRSQAAAAAAKQTQAAIEPSASFKCRKKTEKKKVRRNSKKLQQSPQVLTKGALKGFDGIKVSIPTSDINMSAIVPAIPSPKKKKKGNSKKKERVSEPSNKHDNQRHAGDGTTSQKEVDVYEFLDNEDAVFEFRPSTLMERFKSISYKDTPGTSKLNPGVDDANNSRDSVSDGDDFVYMSDDYICSDDETENSRLSCELSSGKVGCELKKNTSPLKRKDAVEKNAVMGKIFKFNAVRSDKRIIKAKETPKPKANLDQLFDSLLEDEPNSSVLNNNDAVSPKNDDFVTPKKHDNSSRYEKYSRTLSSRDDSSSPTKSKSPSPKRHMSSPKEYDRLSLIDYGPSTSKAAAIDFGPSTSKIRDSTSPKDFKDLSSKKYDAPSHKLHEVSQKHTTLKHSEPSHSKSDAITIKKRDSKKEKSPSSKLDEGISTSYDYNADVFDLYDDTGVARQRARRKCTVGKQNVLAETWSSESEPDGIPPRPNSAESVVLTSARRKKGKKRDSHHAGARRGNNRHISFKKQDVESRLSSCSRNTARGAEVGASRARRSSDDVASVNPYDAPAPSTSTAHLLLGPPGPRPRPRTTAYYNWSSDGDDEPEHVQQHGWIVGDSHKKLVTMLAHAKGRKRNNDDKRHLVE